MLITCCLHHNKETVDKKIPPIKTSSSDLSEPSKIASISMINFYSKCETHTEQGNEHQAKVTKTSPSFTTTPCKLLLDENRSEQPGCFY